MFSCLMSAFKMVVVLKNPLETCLVSKGSMTQRDLKQGCDRCLPLFFPPRNSQRLRHLQISHCQNHVLRGFFGKSLEILKSDSRDFTEKKHCCNVLLFEFKSSARDNKTTTIQMLQRVVLWSGKTTPKLKADRFKFDLIIKPFKRSHHEWIHIS